MQITLNQEVQDKIMNYTLQKQRRMDPQLNSIQRTVACNRSQELEHILSVTLEALFVEKQSIKNIHEQQTLNL